MIKYPAFVKNTYWSVVCVSRLNKLARVHDITVTAAGKNPNKKICFTKGNKRLCISKRHERYFNDIIHNFDYHFDAVLPVEQDGTLVVDYSSARKHVLTRLGVAFTFTSFPESTETTDIYLEKAKLTEGNVVIDVGAYCGATAWAFAKAVGEKGKVLAFEPDNENFQALCQNVSLHAMTNVIPIKKGIWSSSAKLLFQGDGNTGSAMSKFLPERSNVYEVETISLDDVCSDYGLTRVDFIKMDIEGSEVEVLKSAKELLKRFKPLMIIEPHMVGGKVDTEMVCDILRDADYSCEVLDQVGLQLPLIFARPN